MTPEHLKEMEAFVKQRFDIVEITEENRQSVPTGRYVHVSQFSRAIYYISELLKEIASRDLTRV